MSALTSGPGWNVLTASWLLSAAALLLHLPPITCCRVPCVPCYDSSRECLERHQPEHSSHCTTCQDLQSVINVDMERFIQPVPFRTPPPEHRDTFG